MGWLRSLFLVPAHPVELAVFRLVVFSTLLWVLAGTGYSHYASIPADLRVAPAGYELFFGAIPFDLWAIRGAKLVALSSAFLACIGLWTRPAALVACLSSVYLLGIPEFFGKIDHVHHHLIWFSALLAASRSGDALSVDAWRSARRGGTRSLGESVAYGLPLRFAWLLIGLTYFFPGVAKLAAGPEWFLGDNIRNTLWHFWTTKDFLPSLRIDAHPWLYRSSGALTILFELSFVFLVFSRRLRPLAVAGGIAFHALTYLQMRIDFGELLACYVVFFDWEEILRRVFPRRPRTEASAGAARADPRLGWVTVVGSVLVAANLYCGVRRIDSWPFSHYPRFSRIRSEPTTTYLELSKTDAEGRRIALDPPMRRSAVQRILRVSDEDLKQRKLRALRELLERSGAVKSGDSVEFHEVTITTVPGEGGRELARRLLLRYP